MAGADGSGAAADIGARGRNGAGFVLRDGDLAFALAREAKARIIGADFSHTMLVRAREKSAGAGNGTRTVKFFEADALRLPFADGSFDLVTSAFGFRNLANYEEGLREIWRVLKPGGTLAILEFTEPARGVIGESVPVLLREGFAGDWGMISGDATAYRYLPKSVERFYRPEEFVGKMGEAGYAEAR